MWSSDKKLYSSSTFKARFPAAVWEVSLRPFPVETPEDRKKESRRLYTPVIWQRTKLAPPLWFLSGLFSTHTGLPKLNLIWQQSSIVSRNTAVRRVRMRERFNEWGVLSEPSCVFRNFAREIGVRSAKIDLFAHTRRLTAVLSYDKQFLLTITNTYWAVFQETNLLYFFSCSNSWIGVPLNRDRVANDTGPDKSKIFIVQWKRCLTRNCK